MFDGLPMVGIHSATPVNYTQSLNGYIGLLPTNDVALSNYNFLGYLKSQSKIDHKIIAFFIDSVLVTKGSVQVGAY